MTASARRRRGPTAPCHSDAVTALPPLAAGSVSLRLYPHAGLDATATVTEMLAQGRLAAEAGFDGVMTSEHHGGFAGYLPNPLQMAGWLLDTMPRGWAAPCPLLLTLRPTALVAEEVAWLAARYPDRVGLGIAAGSLADDFEIMGVSYDDRATRFTEALVQLAGLLGGGAQGRLADDPALARCRTHPVPMVSAAMSAVAVRRAARHGLGLLFDSLSSVSRVRELVDVYRHAGGGAACVLIRRVWVGEPPSQALKRQVDVYRTYAAAGAQSYWTADEAVVGDTADQVAEQVTALLAVTGADALNLRVHAPGIDASQVRAQIEALAAVVTRCGAAGQARQRSGRPPL